MEHDVHQADPSANRQSRDDAPSTVCRFVSLLRERYQTLRGGGAVIEPAALDERLATLMLAGAALRDATIGGAYAARPSQVVVLGPTQSGKSTVVNLLLGARAAEVSPVAGFTIHARGFVVSSCDSALRWADGLFPGWERRGAAELSREALEAYALGPAPDGAIDLAAGRGFALWDTPDFDSLAAHSYQRGVLETAALADVIVLVLSKEKYSDLSVWKMLALIEPLARPLVICLNKLTEDGADAVARSLRDRLGELGGHYAGAPIVRLPQHPRIDECGGAELPAVVHELRDSVRTLTANAERGGRGAAAGRLIRKHWDDWVAPIRSEQAALEEWNKLARTATDDALSAYRRDFLEHPKRFDTFRRAVVELLHLLELPGIAGALSRVRYVLTWPARQLFAARESWALQRRARSGRPHGLGSEETVLFDGVDALLTRLARDAARRCDPSVAGAAVWRALSKRLEVDEAALRERLRAAAREHHVAFQAHVQAAADRLYEMLQRKPAMLNTLRAARVTVDAAGIALAIKTAGVGAADLIVAPALFSVTSMLTEGALGSYMRTVAEDLKRRQYAAVERDVVRAAWEPALRELAANLDDAGLFGLAAGQADEARAALDAWEERGYA